MTGRPPPLIFLTPLSIVDLTDLEVAITVFLHPADTNASHLTMVLTSGHSNSRLGQMRQLKFLLTGWVFHNRPKHSRLHLAPNASTQCIAMGL